MSADAITAEQALVMLREDESVAFVDVRDASAYGKGHIPGAINLPFTECGVEEYLQRFDSSQRIVVYCYMGVASQGVANKLVEAGFANAVSMLGGYTAWRLTDGVPDDEIA